MTLAKIRRVLRPAGFGVNIDWLTPFLRFVHAICVSSSRAAVFGKLDALATMIENERET